MWLTHWGIFLIWGRTNAHVTSRHFHVPGDKYAKNSVITRCLHSIPTDLPIPMDDGACQHLENMLMPDISLSSTDDKRINLSQLAGWNVIFCYPMTGRPGFAIPEGWEQIPGAAGCTLQARSYRERHAEFKRNRVGVYGLSSQTPESQKEVLFA